MDSEVKSVVKAIQNEYISKRRIEARKKYEDQAAQIIIKNLGKLDKEHIQEIADLLDTDLWAGRTKKTRFGLLFKGGRLILANDEDIMSLLFSEVDKQGNTLWEKHWSPQSKRGGGDIYKNMREIKQGDVVLHLIDNESIVGISIVDKECDSNFFCLPGTAWYDGTGTRPGYLVILNLRNLQKS